MTKIIFCPTPLSMAAALLLASAPAGAVEGSPSGAGRASAVSLDQGRAGELAMEAARIGDLAPARALLSRPDVPDPLADLVRAQLAAARLEGDAVRAALDRYFAAGDTDPARRARAREIAAETAFANGRYDEAARHAGLILTRGEAMTSEEAADMRRMMEIAILLSTVPAQRLDTRGEGAPAPLARDKVGLYRTPISAGGSTEQAVLDTGANLSVASASAARRMNLRMIDGTTSIGNAVGGGVDIRIGIADRLDIAGATLTNVAFVVMEDEALTFPIPGGYGIDTIIGLPVLRALGRLRFGSDETLRVETLPDDDRARGNLRFIGSSPYVMATINGIAHPLYFDTGATATSLTSRFAAARPALSASDKGKMMGKAGAGGAERVRYASFDTLSIGIGGQTVDLTDVTLDLSGESGSELPYGVLGIDVLASFGGFTIDFDSMTLEVEATRGGSPAKAGS